MGCICAQREHFEDNANVKHQGKKGLVLLQHCGDGYHCLRIIIVGMTGDYCF